MLKARENLQEAFELTEAEGWESVKEKGGIGLWKKKATDSSINIIKRSMEVDVPLQDVLSFYKDPEAIKSVNKKIVENYVVHSFNDTCKLIRREIKGGMLVSNRDLSIFSNAIHLTDGSVAISMFSVEHDKVPKTKAVRAVLDIGLIYLKPVSESSTSVLSCIRFDPKGSIPTTLVNKMAKRQHEEFENIKKLLEGKKK